MWKRINGKGQLLQELGAEKRRPSIGGGQTRFGRLCHIKIHSSVCVAIIVILRVKFFLTVSADTLGRVICEVGRALKIVEAVNRHSVRSLKRAGLQA